MSAGQNMVRIDGSAGEGGGQILRTSLCLSVITGRPFVICKIRAGRRQPGLLRQHLTAVKAAAAVCRARVTGDRPGSGDLEFIPGAVRAGSYCFDIGSAGSGTLVLQAILPALLTANGPSTVILSGGTHNPFAPPLDFLCKAFLPVLTKMGARVNIGITRYGFYPAGGGCFTAEINPAATLKSINLLDFPEKYVMKAYAFSAQIPGHIIRREIHCLQEKLPLTPELCLAEQVDSPGPGNVVMVEVAGEAVTGLFTGFGAKGVPLERVCDSVVKQVRTYLRLKAPVGRYLADQLLIPMALAGRGRFRTMPPTQHTLTNMEVIKKFLDVKMTAEEVSSGVWEVVVG